MTKLNRNRILGRQGIFSLSSSSASSSSSSSSSSEKSSPDGFNRFRLFFHLFLCVAALTLGFQVSREGSFIIAPFRLKQSALFSPEVSELHAVSNQTNHTALVSPEVSELLAVSNQTNHTALFSPEVSELHAVFNQTNSSFVDFEEDESFTMSLPQPSLPEVRSGRVHVGRHEILIRPWPHPDPLQSIAAHHLMDIVQAEQRRIYGVEENKQLLVITPTHVHAFQAVYLTCLIHTLRVVPSPLIWIVIEAGGISNETTALLSSSKLSYHHLTLATTMPEHQEQRVALEMQLRIEGLRFVRDKLLDGIILFADESNTYSLDLFKEARKVSWIGAFSVGVLLPNVLHNDLGNTKQSQDEDSSYMKIESASKYQLPLVGPACNANGYVVGWYYGIEDSTQDTRFGNNTPDWSAFALNSRIFWKDQEKPSWIKDWDDVIFAWEKEGSLGSPFAILTNASYLEPLGNCGRDVVLWKIRSMVDRIDKEFPSRWIINPPLDVVVPSRSTPWQTEDFATPNFIPPPSLPSALETIRTPQATQRQNKNSKSGKGRKGSRRMKQGRVKTDGEQ